MRPGSASLASRCATLPQRAERRQRTLPMLRRIAFGFLLLVVATTAVGGVALWTAMHRLAPVVVEKFRTHRWKFPSKIYADSLLIYPGMDLQAVGFFDRLHDLDYQAVDHEVTRKGEYRFEKKAGLLDIWLHDFPYPTVAGISGVARLEVSGNVVVRMEDLTTHKELYAFELEPELITGLYQGIWEERHLVEPRRGAAVAAARHHRRGRPALLRAPRHRHRRHRAGAVGGRAQRPCRAGRQHADAAAHEELLPDRRAQPQAETDRGADGADRRAAVLETRDPDELHQRDLSRPKRRTGDLRRVGGVAVLLRQGAAGPLGGRDRHARQLDQGAEPLLAVPRSGGLQAPSQLRADADAEARRYQRRAVRRRGRRAGAHRRARQ